MQAPKRIQGSDDEGGYIQGRSWLRVHPPLSRAAPPHPRRLTSDRQTAPPLAYPHKAACSMGKIPRRSPRGRGQPVDGRRGARRPRGQSARERMRTSTPSINSTRYSRRPGYHTRTLRLVTKITYSLSPLPTARCYAGTEHRALLLLRPKLFGATSSGRTSCWYIRPTVR